ncbi:tetratricopeptide repeat protein [Magnetococcales bacterium HHB-1]
MIPTFNQLSIFSLVGFLLWAVPTDANDIDAIYRLADQRQFTKAEKAISRFLEHNPEDPRAKFLKGLILTEQKRNKEAIEIFKQLSEDYPQLPEPFNNLAILYAERGEYEKARDALIQVTTNHPNYATGYENLGDVYANLASQAYHRAWKIDQNNRTVQEKLALTKKFFTSIAQQDLAVAQQSKIAQKPFRSGK